MRLTLILMLLMLEIEIEMMEMKMMLTDLCSICQVSAYPVSVM